MNHKLAERTYVVREEDKKSGKIVERIADLKKDKDNVFLLGPAGAEIPHEQALELGLVKAPKEK